MNTAETLCGQGLYPAGQMHLIARWLDRMLERYSTEPLDPFRASLYLIVRDWAIENRVLYSPYGRQHPFIRDSFSSRNAVNKNDSIIESTCSMISGMLGGASVGDPWSSFDCHSLPFRSLYMYQYRGQIQAFAARQSLSAARPSHLELFLAHKDISAIKATQLLASDISQSNWISSAASTSLHKLARLLDKHMELPEIKMILELTSSYISLTSVAKMYVPLAIAGCAQAFSFFDGSISALSLDCVSDPSSIGVMIAALHLNIEISEVVHGSFLDHTAVAGGALSRACLQPTQFLCLERVSPFIVKSRSHYSGVQGRWASMDAKCGDESDPLELKSRANMVSLYQLPKNSEVLIIDATSAEQDKGECKQLEEALSSVIGTLMLLSLSINLKAHPRLGLGLPMLNAIGRHPKARINLVNNSCTLAEIKDNYAAFIFTYETNSWKELLDCDAKMYILNTRSLLDLELLSLGIVDLLDAAPICVNL